MSAQGDVIGRVFLGAAVETFAYTKRMGDGVLRQLSGEELRRVVGGAGADLNSIAVIVKHLRGNMLSRWTDFLTSDGEKAWRDRDGEFVEDDASREEVLGRWEEGWGCLFEGMRALTGADLGRTVRIRGEEQSVARAILRQMEHHGYHVGQMVVIGKMIRGGDWETLTIPRGGSAAHNRRMGYEAG